MVVPFWTRPALAQAAQASMASRVDYQVGGLPLGIMVADLDGDGHLDLVSVNQSSDDLSLMKGFGDGTFREIGRVAAGVRPSGAVLADADNDGHPDLVVSNLTSQEVGVHLGDGVGGFGPKLGSPVGSTPSGLAVGDWNGDGLLDVATVNSRDDNVSRLLGDGTGRFTTLMQLSVGATPKDIIAADFNGDGPLDLAVVNEASSTVQIFHGDGAGQFNLVTTLGTGLGPIFLMTSDLNKDSILDIAVANTAGDTLDIFLGNMAGGFDPSIVLNPGLGPQAIAAADVDADTHLDLVVSRSKVVGVGEVAIMTGDGAGGFSAPMKLSSGPSPNSVGVADFDGDGGQDLVTTNRSGNSISVILSIGGGSFLEAGRIDLPFGSFPHPVVVTDFDNDLNMDVASSNVATENVSVTTGNGAGGFSAVNSANNVGVTPISMAPADFNQDGDVDLVTANNGDQTLSYLQGSGSGNFTVTNGMVSGCLEGTVAVSVGDISGDGFIDVAFVCEESDEYCTRRGTGGSGASAFGPAVCNVIGRIPAGVAVGSYNLDGFEDAAISASGSDVVQIAISDGNGGLFDIPTDFPVGDRPKGVVTGDVNADGFLDLIVTNTNSDDISVLLGDGGGIFSFPSIDSPVGRAPTAVALADFNLDGHLDAAVTNANANSVSLLLGDGLGNFSNAGNFGTRDLPLGVGAGDFDSDGRPDLAIADNFTDTITIMLNKSVTGDPLATFVTFGGADRTVFRWGLIPGAVYDLIRGEAGLVTEGATTFDLGPVTCLADDLEATDTAEAPDTDIPPPGSSYFYAVRAVVGGIPGEYTVSTNGKPGVPSAGGCP
jgi:hypothetical protein